MSLEDNLLATIEPLVQRLVDEAIQRAKLDLQEAQLRSRWLTTGQAAKRLGISPVAVRHRARRGQLPSNYIGSRLYIDMEEFERRLGN
jgi:Helix-turn-helix domain